MRWSQVIVSSMIARTCTPPSRTTGRGVISPLVKNEPVLAMKIAAKDGGAGLPPVIPEGQRAISVRVDDVIGVAGYVLPGTKVPRQLGARVLYRDGLPLATLVAGQVELLASLPPEEERAARRALLREPDSTAGLGAEALALLRG